jgi:hypothetical protein
MSFVSLMVVAALMSGAVRSIGVTAMVSSVEVSHMVASA